METEDHNDGNELIRCKRCINGRWQAACCNGANRCDCHGELIDMGKCNVCGGRGWHRYDADVMANIKKIRGRCFIGSGPTSGYWAGK